MSLALSLPSLDIKVGERPPLIYLPGMDGTGQLFYRQAQHLDPFFRLRSLDFNHLAQESWDSLVEYVLAQIDPALPAVLCGESFGGCLAMLVAARQPQRCSGLVLVNPASSFRRQGWLMSAHWMMPFLPEAFYRFVAERGAGTLAELSRLGPGDRLALAKAVRSVSFSRAKQRLQLLAEFVAESLPLESLQMPVLLVAGGSDRLLPSVEEAHRLSSRIPGSQVQILPESGHACLLERDFNLLNLMAEQPALLCDTLPTLMLRARASQ